MLSPAKIKLINSLRYKKYRDRYGLFVIEGDKLVSEFLESGKPVNLLLAKAKWIEKTGNKLLSVAEEIIEVNERELGKLSQLKTPQNTLALVYTEKYSPETSSVSESLSIALDNIKDPGNLGTIIRIAAWFGIENILCSYGTVDVYNPKTVQSSMGALLYVKVSYTELSVLLPELIQMGTQVYAATLDGEPLQNLKKTENGILLFGNESRGISNELLPYVTNKIIIPPFRKVMPGIDSLNVAMSAAIICNEFRRDWKVK